MNLIIGKDQYGKEFVFKTPHPRKELMEMLGRKSASKLYIDTKDGVSKHVGYVVGSHWVTLYHLTEWIGGKI